MRSTLSRSTKRANDPTPAPSKRSARSEITLSIVASRSERLITPTLISRVLELRDLRTRAARHAENLRLRTEAFKRDNAGLIESVKEHVTAVDAAEVALRAVATAEYERTKERKPAPGLEIKLFTQYAIDEVAGLAWAKEKDLCLIPAKLDVGAIKKLATVQSLSFVTITELLKVQIATDLSKCDLPDPGSR
jgi:hypothetical protein